jgi:hypothetical protein
LTSIVFQPKFHSDLSLSIGLLGWRHIVVEESIHEVSVVMQPLRKAERDGITAVVATVGRENNAAGVEWTRDRANEICVTSSKRHSVRGSGASPFPLPFSSMRRSRSSTALYFQGQMQLSSHFVGKATPRYRRCQISHLATLGL